MESDDRGGDSASATATATATAATDTSVQRTGDLRRRRSSSPSSPPSLDGNTSGTSYASCSSPSTAMAAAGAAPPHQVVIAPPQKPQAQQAPVQPQIQRQQHTQQQRRRSSTIRNRRRSSNFSQLESIPDVDDESCGWTGAACQTQSNDTSAAQQARQRRSSLLSIPDDIELDDLLGGSLTSFCSFDDGNNNAAAMCASKLATYSAAVSNGTAAGNKNERHGHLRPSQETKKKKKPKHTFCICDISSSSSESEGNGDDMDSNCHVDGESVASAASVSSAGFGDCVRPSGSELRQRRMRRSSGHAVPTQQQQVRATSARRNSLFNGLEYSDNGGDSSVSGGWGKGSRRTGSMDHAAGARTRRRNSLFRRRSSSEFSDGGSVSSGRGKVNRRRDSDSSVTRGGGAGADRVQPRAQRRKGTAAHEKHGTADAASRYGIDRVGPVACPASQRATVHEPTGVELWRVFYSTVERSADQGTTGVNVLLKRTTYLAYLFLTIVVAFGYAVMYAVILGEPVAAILALAYCAVAGISIEATVRYELWGYSTVLLKVLVVNPFLVQFALGGIVSSGAVMMWGLLSPVGAALILDPRQARWYLLAYVVNVTNASLFELFAPYVPEVDRLSPWDVLFFWCQYVAFGVTVMATASIFASQFETEQSNSEGLLLNILPAHIAKRLKRGESPIVDHYDSVTILFADLVGFTEASSELPPNFLIGTVLKDIFLAFDDLVERRNLEKIKTIGDAYMVVGGLNADDAADGGDGWGGAAPTNYAQSVVLLGLEFADALKDVNRRHGTSLRLRVGVHTGPVIAGVLGVNKFAFDVWGDAVNTASRMGSHGVPGLVHVSLETYSQLCASDEGRLFECRRGLESFIKGKGVMTTFLVSRPHPRLPDELGASDRTLKVENLSSVSTGAMADENNDDGGVCSCLPKGNDFCSPEEVNVMSSRTDDSIYPIATMHDSGSTALATQEDDMSALQQSSTGKLWLERAQGIASKVDEKRPSPLARFIKKYPKMNTRTVWHKLAVRISPTDSPQSTIMKREALICFWLLSILVSAVSAFVFYCFGNIASAALAASYIFFTGSAAALAIRFRSFGVFETAHMLGLLSSTLIGSAFLYGGVCKFGNGIVWMFLFPLSSATFHSPRKAQVWYLAYVIATCLGYSFDSSYLMGYLSRAQAVQFAMNNIGPLTVIFTAFHLYATEIKKEYSYSETLLRNTMPESIAMRLRNGENPIIDNFENVSILFADLVGFTQASTKMCPSFLIGIFLRDIFFEFDKLVKERGLEKIKTIGDAYMVVGGLKGSDGSVHHAYQMVMLGTELVDALRIVNERLGTSFEIRIGINTGPATAGVLGVKKFIYDVWGDAVNVAKQMESHGTPGLIHVSSSTYDLIRDLGCFECRSGKEFMIKRKGTMRTHLVSGRKGAKKAD